MDFYSDLARLSAEVRGAHVWNENDERTLFELVQDPANYWEENSHASGMPNWKLITEKLSLTLKEKFIYKQVQEKYWDILKRLKDDYPELVEQYEGNYYIPEQRVDWESLVEIVHRLILSGMYYHRNGSYIGSPDWNVVLIGLQRKGFLNNFDLENPIEAKRLAKQLSKAYNKYLIIDINS